MAAPRKNIDLPAQPLLFRQDGTPAIDFAQAITDLSAADAKLGKLIAKVGPFQPRYRKLTSVYQALGQAILRQQVSGAAADAIQAKLNRLFGARVFPSPEQLATSTAEQLRTAGVSGSKARALIELAQKAVAGGVPVPASLRKLDDAAIIEALTVHRGIGRWTVEMMLMFRLGRADVLPIDDYGIRKGFMLTFGLKELPAPKAMLPRAERWRPYRTIASWYLWRALEL